jgi:hypothetical protein
LILALYAWSCKGGSDSQFSKTITFKTASAAPSDFDAWSFSWSYPRWEKNAQLDCIILTPDGDQFFQQLIEQNSSWNPLTSATTEFAPGNPGGDPGLFRGKDIRITFRVTKGFLMFSPDGFYEFKFYKDGLDGSMISLQPAALEE